MRLSTMVTDGTLLKVYAWYDNEMGYACRMVDLACHMQRGHLSPRMGTSRRADERRRTRNYAIVTAAYWGFTLTDGALRMLVLLHFYRLGYSPFTLAFLFLLYEAHGHRGQPDRRLAGHALRHQAHAHGGPGHADHRASCCCRPVDPGRGRRRCRWPGWCSRRACAAWPRT
jgi:hypothetical protein